MKYAFQLRKDDEGELWLERPSDAPRRVVTVATACKRLRRTRRQVYRMMKAGHLGQTENMLGEWLLDHAAVEAPARSPMAAQALPGRLSPLFPEYEPKALNAGRDSMLIISRVLEGGGRDDVRWLLKRYTRREIRRVVEDEGSRLLSPQSKKLWSLVFKETPRPLADWRQADPWLGP